VGRFAFFSLLVPLYSRLKKDKLLENFTRGRIYGHIETHPGIHYSELLRDLNLGNGNLAYHLKTLERERMIRSERMGQLRLFFPKNGKKEKSVRFDPLVRRADRQATGTRRSVMNLITATPGLTEIEIAQWLGLSKQNTHYHIRKLENGGAVRVKRAGGNARCYPSEKGQNGGKANEIGHGNGNGLVNGSGGSHDSGTSGNGFQGDGSPITRANGSNDSSDETPTLPSTPHDGDEFKPI
jgi:predicted transcriptional regulator